MKRREKLIVAIVALALAILLLAFFYGCREGGRSAGSVWLPDPTDESDVVRV